MNRLAIFSLRNRALIALVTVVVAIFGGIAMSLLALAEPAEAAVAGLRALPQPLAE